MWSQGTINGYNYWVKHYEEESMYGINEGKISKMTIRKGGVEFYNFDRGLDFDNLDADGRAVYEELLKLYN